jgi:hypothetical protein
MPRSNCSNLRWMKLQKSSRTRPERLAFRRRLAAELATHIRAAIAAGHLPEQDAEFALEMGGSSTEKGLTESLKLLSIAQTLRNKNVSLLSFLRSGKTTIGEYLAE